MAEPAGGKKGLCGTGVGTPGRLAGGNEQTNGKHQSTTYNRVFIAGLIAITPCAP